ncbi:hypothetical protein SPRG_09314 [Saprolegnia parasitica CBS 223.65]|uniref:F-box domain-containing protein n=1 Tax=Saprolegnia parasitica (strain CBS 223.65) TaxID=695850 RepID=A0A067C4C9_SAPPC|nr:hypothetical protein SPRG_09314 [Saprolegnia parasitica CBS 223.65]KDO25373.1 hypothetical protein SPRG_09314 [Saprolegnia parasitica CBS 223.65]|eukprot:XP_012203801.1 hypothetical protein SPRG_09314 [Saprolegnia parasitica CBS 223.65]
MAEVKRARAEASPWLLPPIVLQVVHCLDATDDVLAFLRAVPSSARDEALDALATLLTEDADLWPVAAAADLNGMDVATVTRALPAFRQLAVDQSSDVLNRCRNTLLLLTTAGHAIVDYPFDLQSSLGHWARNVVGLTIRVDEVPVDAGVLQQQLATCKDLRALTSFGVKWRGPEVNQEQLDGVMTAITALCPNISDLRFTAAASATLESCESLREWLGQPRAQQFDLNGINFFPAAAKTLAHALLAAPMLHTIKLEDSSMVLGSFLDGSHALPPRQLRDMTIQVWDNWDRATFPSTLRSLKLLIVTLRHFPLQLPELERLQLRYVDMTDDSVADLAAFLAATTTLHQLDLAYTYMNDDRLKPILNALPTWLDRQRRACYVRLDAMDVTAAALPTVLAQIRNTHEVQIELCGADNLELAVGQRIVAALGATSQIKLRFANEVWAPDDVKAASPHVQYTNGWFLSPRAPSS